MATVLSQVPWQRAWEAIGEKWADPGEEFDASVVRRNHGTIDVHVFTKNKMNTQHIFQNDGFLGNSNLAMVQDLYLRQISGVYQFYNKIPWDFYRLPTVYWFRINFHENLRPTPPPSRATHLIDPH